MLKPKSSVYSVSRLHTPTTLLGGTSPVICKSSECNAIILPALSVRREKLLAGSCLGERRPAQRKRKRLTQSKSFQVVLVVQQELLTYKTNVIFFRKFVQPPRLLLSPEHSSETALFSRITNYPSLVAPSHPTALTGENPMY
ncbi:hypothetical protein Tcan_01076, partial [Toxocara canis]